MSKNILLLAAAAMFILLSCNKSADKKATDENEPAQTEQVAEEKGQEVLLVKSIEKIYDGESAGTIYFKYDDQNRLVSQKDEYDEYTVSYATDEIKVKEESATTTYKYSDGKLTTGCIDMGKEGKINIKYN